MTPVPPTGLQPAPSVVCNHGFSVTCAECLRVSEFGREHEGSDPSLWPLSFVDEQTWEAMQWIRGEA